MQKISNKLQRLVELRRSPNLKVAYQEQWANLKNRASELLNSVSQKCIKIQAAAYMHHFSTMHNVEDQAPLMYLANTPYFPESDYMTREAKMFKLLKQKIVKQQEDAKAREDLLLQKQLELEAALRKQAALIDQLMNKQPNPQKHTYFFCFCSLFCFFLNYVFFIFIIYIYSFYSESFHLYLCFSLLSFFCYVFFVNDKRESSRKYLIKTLSPS